MLCPVPRVFVFGSKLDRYIGGIASGGGVESVAIALEGRAISGNVHLG
jgi:hypothetical protein